MTEVNIYQASAQAGKIIKKEMVASKKWVMDSVGEIFVKRQSDLLELSKQTPKSIISLDYYEVLNENVVFEPGTKKVAKKESSDLDQAGDLSEELKAKSPRKRAARPAKPEAQEEAEKGSEE